MYFAPLFQITRYHRFFGPGLPMKPLIILGCCLLLLAGCQDKHDPVKPTVAAIQPA
jgi:hypothetical protein